MGADAASGEPILSGPRHAARASRFAAALVLVGQLGCSRNTPPQGAASNTVSIVFSNESTTRAEVWVGAIHVASQRVGSVLPGETTTLRVPKEFMERDPVIFTARLRDSSLQPYIEAHVRKDEELRLRLPIDAKRIVEVR